MISDDELMDMPEDPLEAFLYIEELARAKMLEAVDREPHGTVSLVNEIAYVNTIVAAAGEFSINEMEWVKRFPSEDNQWLEHVRAIVSSVDYLRLQYRLRNARKLQKYSVAFDPATKKKLNHLLTQIRDTVTKLEITEPKRERLFKRIEALQLEIDQNRTRMEALSGFISELAVSAEPLVELGMKVARIFGEKKAAEDEARGLPAPEKPKQIEPPKKSAKKSNDDISS